MSTALIIIGYTLFVLAAGIAIGATIVRDLLDGVLSSRKPARKPTLPLATVLTRAEAKQLELPAIKRRQRIRTVLGWERRP